MFNGVRRLDCIVDGINSTQLTGSDIFYALNKVIKSLKILQSKLLFWIPTILSKLSFHKVF